MEIFKRIYEGITIGLDSIKPRVKCSEINDRIIGYLEKCNISNTDTHGHGIGLQPGEYPVIASNILNYTYFDGFETRNADFYLEENMVINLEIPYYIFGEGSYIVEVSALVANNGFKRLTPQKRDYPIINY